MEYTNEQIIENRRKWEEALESGDYKKGTRYLRSKDDEYCCLGVACELFDGDSELGGKRYLYGNQSATATFRVVSALGLYSENGLHKDGASSLARINDSSYSFEPVISAIKTGNYYRELT